MQRRIRTFVAVEAPGDVCGSAARLIARLRTAPAKVRWVEPPLHFTLKFLGDVDILEIPEVCRAVADAVADIPPFDLEIRGVGAFPNLDRPRTLWIGTGSGTDEMVQLHQRIEKSLTPLGFRAEGRRYRPHLTIGRVRNGPEGIAELGRGVQDEADYRAGEMLVDELSVFSSRLERTGPVYEVLGRAELA